MTRRLAMLLMLALGCGVPRRAPNGGAEWREMYAACERGDPYACFWKALGIEDEDPTLARELTEKSCASGIGEACNGLGFLAVEGRSGMSKDPVRARALWEQSCRLGDPNGCDSYGTGLRDGVGGPVDFKAAIAAYQKACTGKNGAGCSNLGLAYANGDGIERDPGRARAVWADTCANVPHFHTSCRHLGEVMVEGVGGPVERAAGVAALRKACRRGNATECHRAGVTLLKINEREAGVAALRVSCGWGNQTACVLLATELAYPSREAMLDAEGESMTTRACKGGFAAACAPEAEANSSHPPARP